MGACVRMRSIMFSCRTMQDMFGDEVEVIDKGQKFDDGAYFQIGADGKATLKAGAKKIDISKLSKDDLKKMGIDPDTMTKEEIARKLKVVSRPQ